MIDRLYPVQIHFGFCFTHDFAPACPPSSPRSGQLLATVPFRPECRSSAFLRSFPSCFVSTVCTRHRRESSRVVDRQEPKPWCFGRSSCEAPWPRPWRPFCCAARRPTPRARAKGEPRPVCCCACLLPHPPALSERLARAWRPTQEPPRPERARALIAPSPFPAAVPLDMWCDDSLRSAPTISWATSSNRIYVTEGCATMADIYEERSDKFGPKGPIFHFDQVCLYGPAGFTSI